MFGLGFRGNIIDLGCSFSCQPADDLSNFPDNHADIIHGREFYPFTRTNDADYQVDILNGYLLKLKSGGAVVLSMVCLSKGLCNNWRSARLRMLESGYDTAERKMLIHPGLFSRWGAICYSQPLYALLVLAQHALGRMLGRKNTYVYIFIR